MSRKINARWISGFALMALLAMAATARAQLTSTNYTRGDGFTVVEFTLGSGTWTVPSGVTTIELLVVGGGGAGLGYGGGGGGGGFYENLSFPVTSGGSISITVGTGGVGGTTRSYTVTSTSAANGTDSIFGSVTAYGGLGGNWFWTGEFYAGYGQGGTSGTGLVAGNNGGAYGSGSGAGVAGTMDGSNADSGGAGLSSSITGSTRWYGGGGGAIVNGSGGLGGGGAGGSPPIAGTINTGGGGGGGWGVDGAAGGSGIVIVAYQLAAIPEPSTWALVGLAMIPLFFRRSRKI